VRQLSACLAKWSRCCCINTLGVVDHLAGLRGLWRVQMWADTFISELNDTHIEADLRMKHTPPELEVAEVVKAYRDSKRRLIVLGYATLTTAVEAPRQRQEALLTRSRR